MKIHNPNVADNAVNQEHRQLGLPPAEASTLGVASNHALSTMATRRRARIAALIA